MVDGSHEWVEFLLHVVSVKETLGENAAWEIVKEAERTDDISLRIISDAIIFVKKWHQERDAQKRKENQTVVNIRDRGARR